MSTPWTSLTDGTDRVSSRGHLRGFAYDLGQVLEHLWIIHQAMLRGTPVPDSEDVLSQIGVAFRRLLASQSDRAGAGS
jgi:hypothetical protein